MGNESADREWVITANRYVAYFDIMGFKDMVLRAPHNEIYEMMKTIDKKIKENVDRKWDIASTNLIKATTYSDSIIIYSKDDSYESLYTIICTVASLTNELLTEAIPHKGALAFGMMTLDIDNSIFFGQPLIDAYLLQEELNLYGVVAHATVEQEIENKGRTEIMPFIDNYLCNFKNSTCYHLMIWPAFATDHGEKDFKLISDKLYAGFKQLRFKTSGHLRKYIDNTETYLKTIGEKNAWPKEKS